MSISLTAVRRICRLNASPAPGGSLAEFDNNKHNRQTMRFMMLMITNGYETAAPGTMPPADAVARMMQYNSELQKAGVLLALDGLHPPSMGSRVTYCDGLPTVTDGPFAESKEVLGGYWIIDVSSKEEAVNWAKRVPASNRETVEVRRLQEFEDFPDDIKTAVGTFEGLPKHS